MTRDTYKLIFMFSLCSFLAPFIGSSTNLALPLIGKEFNMNIVSLGWVATIFLLSMSVFLVPMGRLSDIVGRKKIFVTGVIIFTIASLLCSITLSGALLISIRALQGLGSAMIFSTSMAILISSVSQQKRGLALGISTAGVYLGNSLGPVLGGVITQYLGWRYIFRIAGFLGTIVIIMSKFYLNSSHDLAHARGEKFDLKGSLLYGIAVVAMLYGTTILPAFSGFFIITIGILALIVFCLIEMNMSHPIFDIHLLLNNKKFAMSNLAALLNFSAAFAVPFIMSMYLQYAKNLLPRETGLMLLIAALTMVIGSPIAGKLSDHKDAGVIASLGMGLSATALLTLSVTLSASTPLYIIGLILFCFGLGLSLFATPNTHAAMESISTRHISIASSLLNTMRIFGQTLSMGISMLILSLIVGKVNITHEMAPQLVQSARIIFFVFGILCTIGIFASLARGKSNTQKETLV